MKTIYFDASWSCLPAAFGRGSAGILNPALEREQRTIEIPTNGYHALFHFGVIAQLAALPSEGGTLARAAEVVFFPAALCEMLRLFYAAERDSYTGEHDILVERVPGPEPLEYRLRLNRREYQRTLLRLIDLTREAQLAGHALRLSL